MIQIPFKTIYFEWLPLLAAQLTFILFLYFTFFSRRTLVGFSFYAVFLLGFTVHLFGSPFQIYTDLQTGIFILFSRTFIYTAIAIPALVAALFKQCNLGLSKSGLVILFAVSASTCLCIISIQDIVNYNYILSLEFKASLPFYPTNQMALAFVTFQIVVLFMMPCFYLAYHELNGKRDPINLTFLCGAILLSCFQFASSHIYNAYWVLYLGAIITACCWVVAVYLDMLRIRGRAHVIKDELLNMLRVGNIAGNTKEMEKRLQALADSADGDILRYKLQVREILSRLAEMSIDAGASSETMLARTNASTQAIDKSESTSQIRAIATKELITLGKIVEDSSSKKSQFIVEKAKHYIASHFSEIKDINQVAEYCGTSGSNLMNHFKQQTEQTLNNDLTITRIGAAKTLLETTNITETAFAVGFNNSNYFSTVFKKVTGTTPAQYREKTNQKT